jgi:hypothetical protein
MHDPSTQILSGPGFILWHKDPCRDGSDNSCGWFMRPRHGDKATLERIVNRFEFDWDRVFESDSGKTYYCGLFTPAGHPNLSVAGITLNLFWLAAIEYFHQKPGVWRKSDRFIKNHLHEILLFAENCTDSLFNSITLKFGNDVKREERIRDMAGVIYAWILRKERPWWKHPRWHFWHWRLTVHAWLRFKRCFFTRCCVCHKTFGWSETPHGSWDGDKIWHQQCDKSLRPS